VRTIIRLSSFAALYGFCGCVNSIVGLQSDGTYLLERNERSASCEALTKNLTNRVEVLRTLPAKAKAERETPPPTASSLFGRWFSGPNRGLAAVEEYDRERAHAYAVHRHMSEKKCTPVDLDRELADVAAEMANIRGK
jgi:hypothetical protein